VPLNSGLLDYVEMRTKPGTIVHPVFPAPVYFSTADPSIKAAETVLQAFAKALPDRATAGGYQTGNNITGAGVTADGEPFQWFMFGAGGNGARRHKDGMSGEWHVMANCRNESVELWEHRYPLRIEEFSLVEDSGGRGRERGGLGYRRRLTMLAPTAISSIADRQVIPPWGVEGGEPGKPNRFAFVAADGGVTSLREHFKLESNSKFTNHPLDEGEGLLVEAGGGGGFGPASERDADRVAHDIEYGYVSAAQWADVAPADSPA
jgi:N-methylhydantoinase B/oxoprolinase/acetone carboxylase alpha subunit